MSATGSEIRIEISKVGNKYVALTCQDDGREILSNTFQHNLSSPHNLQPDWLIDPSETQTPSEARTPSEAQRRPGFLTRSNAAQAARDGRRLYRYLFGNGKALRRHLRRRPDTETYFVTLSIGTEAASLWRLPWEYIHDGNTFPGLTGQMLISRRPADLRTLTPQIAAPPLQILAVIANPEDRMAFDTEQELYVLHVALEHLIGPGLVKLEVLPEPTSYALLEAVRAKPYEVIHFVGHGVYHLAQQQGYLCLESDLGRSELLSGAQLPRFLEGRPPRLFVISTPQTTQVGVFDAFAGVANGLLQHDLPSVLSLPVGLPLHAAQDFYRAFYTTLATPQAGSDGKLLAHGRLLTHGSTVIGSLHNGRQALKETEVSLPSDQQRCHWGMPALYQCTPPDLPLIEPIHLDENRKAPAVRGTPAVRGAPAVRGDSASKPVIKSPTPIGRKGELQAIRKEMKTGATVFHLWGSEGIGKQSLISHLLPSLGSHAGATLIIHCRELPEPLTALSMIADFWRRTQSTAQTTRGANAVRGAGDEAAEMLLDPRAEPFERAQAAQMLRAKKRHTVVFDSIDAWFDQGTVTPGTIEDTVLRDSLLGLLSVPSNTLYFLSGTQRWADIARLSTANRREIHLGLLPLEPSIRVMNQWPHLRPLSLEQKREVHWRIGGHPKALQLLDGWLHLRARRPRHGSHGEASGLLAELLASHPDEKRPTETWIHTLNQSILGDLDPGEQAALRALALLRQPFSRATLAALTPVTPQHAASLTEKWARVGLIETLGDNEPPSFDASHGRLLTHGGLLTHGELQGSYLMQPSLQQAIIATMTEAETKALHRQVADYYGSPFVEEARRQILSRNMATWSQDRVAWLARDADGILGLWLRRSEGPRSTQATLNQALAWHAHLRMAGDAEAAGHIARTVAPELSRQGQHDLARRLLQSSEEITNELTRAQRAALGDRSTRAGQREAAVEALKAELERMRTEGNAAGEAECLYRLAAAYREAADARQALVHNQAAVERYEALSYPYGLAAAQRQQGHLLKDLGQPERAIERFAASLRLYRQLDDRPSIAENLVEIGLLFEQLGRTEMAIQVIEEAVSHHGYLKDPEYNQLLALLEQLYARQKRLAEARARVRSGRGEDEMRA